MRHRNHAMECVVIIGENGINRTNGENVENASKYHIGGVVG